jgi:hypothetical protein
MTGKLKIVRVLGNPKPGKKTKRKSAKPRRRAARSLSDKWIVRIITHTRTALYWGGGRWVSTRAGAHKYPTPAAAAAALRKSGAKPAGWIVADVMPA